jgi:hypothetical protein
MTDFTDQDKGVVRDAALGALALVSRADPGFFAMFKESVAGSKAIAAAPAGLRELLTAGGMPTPPQGDAEQVTASVMDKLRSAVALLQAKAPDQVEPFRSVVLEACDAVANASKGVDPAEATVIDQVRTALAGAPATGDEPSVVGT